MDFARIGTNVLSGKGQDCTKGSILNGWPAHIPIIAEKPLNMQVSTLFLAAIPSWCPQLSTSVRFREQPRVMASAGVRWAWPVARLLAGAPQGEPATADAME